MRLQLSNAMVSVMYGLRLHKQLMLSYYKGVLTCFALISQLSCAVHEKSRLDHLYDYRWSDSLDPSKVLRTEGVVEELRDVDVIFFGEHHGHPGIHLAQMEVFKALNRQGRDISLSMEQFERDTQEILNDYLAYEIGESYMVAKARAWDNYKSSYRPLVEFARSNGLAVIASNAPKNMVVCVGRSGLEVLSLYPQEQRQYVASRITPRDGKYREKFLRYMQHDSAHSMPGKIASDTVIQERMRNQFAAQVLRDSTMAESIALHLDRLPSQQVLHLNGDFHSSEFLGVVEELRVLKPTLKLAVIHPVIEGVEDNDEASSATFFLTVLRMPETFVQDTHRKEWVKNVVKKRMDSRESCPE